MGRNLTVENGSQTKSLCLAAVFRCLSKFSRVFLSFKRAVSLLIHKFFDFLALINLEFF